MAIRWFGAVLILAGCGGFGFTLAAGAKQEQRQLCALVRSLDLMETELRYRLTALPELCSLAAGEIGGSLGAVFASLSRSLIRQEQPNADLCMGSILEEDRVFSRRIRRHLRQLGRSLGRYDLQGQLQGLQRIRSACLADLEDLRKNRDARLRSYQTLGLCAGTALVILFA